MFQHILLIIWIQTLQHEPMKISTYSVSIMFQKNKKYATKNNSCS